MSEHFNKLPNTESIEHSVLESIQMEIDRFNNGDLYSILSARLLKDGLSSPNAYQLSEPIKGQGYTKVISGITSSLKGNQWFYPSQNPSNQDSNSVNFEFRNCKGNVSFTNDGVMTVDLGQSILSHQQLQETDDAYGRMVLNQLEGDLIRSLNFKILSTRVNPRRPKVVARLLDETNALAILSSFNDSALPYSDQPVTLYKDKQFGSAQTVVSLHRHRQVVYGPRFYLIFGLTPECVQRLDNIVIERFNGFLNQTQYRIDNESWFNYLEADLDPTLKHGKVDLDFGYQAAIATWWLMSQPLKSDQRKNILSDLLAAQALSDARINSLTFQNVEGLEGKSVTIFPNGMSAPRKINDYSKIGFRITDLSSLR